MELLENDLLVIHKAIHDKEVHSFVLNNVRIDIKYTKYHFRYCEVFGIRFIEQNKLKHSYYARRALIYGDQVTWGIREDAPWVLIVNGEIRDLDKERLYNFSKSYAKTIMN